MFKQFTKEEKSWIYYDVANSAYTLTVISAFIAILFNSIGPENSNSIFQYATGAIAIVIAVLSPILGNLSDYEGYKMKFFKGFLFLGLIFGFLLCIPGLPWQVLLGVYMFATIGYSGANVFYDAFITDVTTEENMDVVSSHGFAWGYIGSVVPFILGLGVYVVATEGIIPMSEQVAISIAFLLSMLWWGAFSIPMIRNVKQKHYIEKEDKWLSKSMVRLVKTIKNMTKHKKIMFFLIGYIFYIDAVYTIIKSAINIGDALGITNSTALVVVLLIVQFIAFPCAIIFGNLTKKYGEKIMLTVGILIYLVICTYGYFINDVFDMFIFGALVGTAQGGVQAVSRSYFGKIIPNEHAGEYFGLYNICGKFATILGPFIVGFAMDATENARFATLSLTPLLIIGLIFFWLSLRDDYETVE